MKRESTTGTILILLIFYTIGYLVTFSFVFLMYWLFGAILSDSLVIGCLIISIFLAILTTILLMFVIATVFVE